MLSLVVSEIFKSIQGETSLTGLPFWFVRLTGCDLRCVYCDSTHAFYGGERIDFETLSTTIFASNTPDDVLFTGGEPLLQINLPEFVRRFAALGKRVHIETHGGRDISTVKPWARVVLDIKTPGSGMWNTKVEAATRANLGLLDERDEIKFVITSNDDYEWAKRWRTDLSKTRVPVSQILFSTALPHETSPGTFHGITAQTLVESMLRDGLPFRFQLQAHKVLWGNRTGV